MKAEKRYIGHFREVLWAALAVTIQVAASPSRAADASRAPTHVLRNAHARHVFVRQIVHDLKRIDFMPGIAVERRRPDGASRVHWIDPGPPARVLDWMKWDLASKPWSPARVLAWETVGACMASPSRRLMWLASMLAQPTDGRFRKLVALVRTRLESFTGREHATAMYQIRAFRSKMIQGEQRLDTRWRELARGIEQGFGSTGNARGIESADLAKVDHSPHGHRFIWHESDLAAEAGSSAVGLPTKASEFTLIHAVRELRVSAWLRRFFPLYQQQGKPPASWFEFDDDGLCAMRSPRTSVEALDYETAADAAFWGSGRSRLILFAANPLRGSHIWKPRRTEDVLTWTRWLADPANPVRQNRFLPRRVASLRRMGWPWHSGFYRDFRIVGLQQSNVDLLLNPAAIGETKLFVPSEWIGTHRDLVIRSRLN